MYMPYVPLRAALTADIVFCCLHLHCVVAYAVLKKPLSTRWEQLW
jgi:hypothetical protein